MKQRKLDVAPEMSVHVEPPFVLNCHCNVGVGFPLAAEVKHTSEPVHTVESRGCSVTTGGVLTVSFPAPEGVEPHALVNTARYQFPSCDAAALKQYGFEVAPETSPHVDPPLVLTCH